MLDNNNWKTKNKRSVSYSCCECRPGGNEQSGWFENCIYFVSVNVMHKTIYPFVINLVAIFLICLPFLHKKTLQKHISTSIWSVQQPDAGQNIQH